MPFGNPLLAIVLFDLPFDIVGNLNDLELSVRSIRRLSHAFHDLN
jgi:hypothetical protein